MADERQLASILAYVEHDQGDVQRRLASVLAYVEHDQGDVQVRLASVLAYVEHYIPIEAEGRVYGPALGVMGG